VVVSLALSVLLIYYQYKTIDDWISTLAGLFAMGVALFPELPAETKDPELWQKRVDFVHHTSAGLFFGCLAFMALFLFTRSKTTKTKLAAPLGQTRTYLAGVARHRNWTSIERHLRPSAERYPTTDMSERKHWRNQIYEGCGIVILICLVLLALNVLFKFSLPLPIRPQVFWLEVFAIWAFGLAWLVKGELAWFLNDPEDKRIGQGPVQPVVSKRRRGASDAPNDGQNPAARGK
jgi:hypothetical protein